MTTSPVVSEATPGIAPVALAPIAVRDLTMRYGARVVMHDLTFEVNAGEVFVIMGGSGSGKSTLLRHLIGLEVPSEGRVLREGADLASADTGTLRRIHRSMGVLFQNGALWSGLTLAENVALPLTEFTGLSGNEIDDVVRLKLALVGLGGYEEFYPAAISGGMRKRAAMARALALDPAVLFFDEPSSGLDPVSASRLDDLILEIQASFGTTIVVVSHDLASIYRIADRALFLDIEQQTMTALGDPAELRDHPPNDAIHQFLTRSSEGIT
jgi:phospholipid/cholesterol/gamma-HCH transport system ATP-binding protein